MTAIKYISISELVGLTVKHPDEKVRGALVARLRTLMNEARMGMTPMRIQEVLTELAAEPALTETINATKELVAEPLGFQRLIGALQAFLASAQGLGNVAPEGVPSAGGKMQRHATREEAALWDMINNS